MEAEKKPNWHIRKARPDEADQIKAISVAAYTMYIDRIGKPPAPMLDDFSELIKRYPVFVAIQDNAIAGILVLMTNPNGILMDNVAIHPDKQDQGLGRALINFAENYARDQGYSHLELYTNELMHENIRLYQSLNYTETRRVLEKGYHRIYMHKRL
jgi:ribosomal protein S18 acetylase RimI-like enzyme